MLLNALKPLIEMRLAGQLPPGDVWVLFGNYEQTPWWHWSGVSVEVVIAETAPVTRLDLRALVGLSVCIQADRYSDQLLRLCKRLKEFARSLNVYVLAWLPEHVGMFWDRGQTDDWRSFELEEAP